MERKIGETFEFEGKKIRVEEDKANTCTGCFFDGRCFSRKVAGECISRKRTDYKQVIFLEVEGEQPQEQAEQPQDEQPQKLNLCEILKYCPEGETFWSPMLNGVKFSDIDDERQMIIVETIEGHFTWEINHDGTISIDEVTSPEVMLYPSKEQRDWTKVKYEKKKELPRTWEEFCEQNDLREGEYFLGNCCNLMPVGKNGGARGKMSDRNILPSREAAEAHLAYMQLHQLRDAWREGWLPEWKEDGEPKFVILNVANELEVVERRETAGFLAFQDEKRADEFKDCFIDYIRKAGDLI